MSVNSLLENVRRYTSLTAEEEAQFCTLFTVKSLKRKEALLQAGTICQHEYYVKAGCLRTYFLDTKGIEHTIYFAIEDWWISDLYSRTHSAPSLVNIVAVEDSELYQVSHLDLEEFMRKTPAMERFFRLSYQQSLVSQHLRSMQMLSMSGQERYVHFREQYPQLVNRIPQKHIATFIGLTPQFFNTIHSKVLRAE
ncbi:Crp/Fnr family transcriptional regulator [Spirosoma endbachense]|uniref:Cyclic nucleotide-binding domain-containing protein n=1 Tax=Spirosoma endbachense TaxID=2666025 RepID=A0A6P1VQN0_9BACT|nr:Crp/Fnr family transcriptional regulator [Spirosoma endbachense]QHV94290.1 cyclic nucleotide-binding domain-containing protein [Spirosoma endbachense]